MRKRNRDDRNFWRDEPSDETLPPSGQGSIPVVTERVRTRPQAQEPSLGQDYESVANEPGVTDDVAYDQDREPNRMAKIISASGLITALVVMAAVVLGFGAGHRYTAEQVGPTVTSTGSPVTVTQLPPPQQNNQVVTVTQTPIPSTTTQTQTETQTKTATSTTTAPAPPPSTVTSTVTAPPVTSTVTTNPPTFPPPGQ